MGGRDVQNIFLEFNVEMGRDAMQFWAVFTCGNVLFFFFLIRELIVKSENVTNDFYCCSDKIV